jgi:hypothetical protein
MVPVHAQSAIAQAIVVENADLIEPRRITATLRPREQNIPRKKVSMCAQVRLGARKTLKTFGSSANALFHRLLALTA